MGNDPLGMFQYTSNGNELKPEEKEQLLVRTSLLYPGGGPVSVYIKADRAGITVTDLGMATELLDRNLRTSAGRPVHWTTTARKVCQGLDVDIRSREWTVKTKIPEEAGQAAMTLAQALLRIAIMTPMFRIIDER